MSKSISVSKSIATSAQPLEETVTLTYTTGADSDSVSVVDNGRSLKQVGLIVLDGEEISADRLSQLDPSRIDAMTVLKGEQGVERYGEKGAEGVIEITTKKSERRGRRMNIEKFQFISVIVPSGKHPAAALSCGMFFIKIGAS